MADFASVLRLEDCILAHRKVLVSKSRRKLLAFPCGQFFV